MVVHLLAFPRVDAVAARTVHLRVDGEKTTGITGHTVPVPPFFLLLSRTTEISQESLTSDLSVIFTEEVIICLESYLEIVNIVRTICPSCVRIIPVK